MADGGGADVVGRVMDALPPQPQLMTVPEFLAWEPGDGRRWQLVDGVAQPMATATLRHNFIQNELALLIGKHLDAQGSPATLCQHRACSRG